MNRTAHAVARQALNDGDPPLTDLALDGPPDFVDANARTRHRGASAKRRFSTGDEPRAVVLAGATTTLRAASAT